MQKITVVRYDLLLYKRKPSVCCAKTRARNKTSPVCTPEKIPARAVDTRLVERHVFRVKFKINPNCVHEV